MPRRTLSLLAAVLVVAVVLTACGGDDEDSSVPASSLQGIEWVLDQQASRLAPVVPAATVTARFSADTLSGSAGCNTYSAGYDVDGGSLTVSTQIASTRRMCEPSLMALEGAYLERLVEVATFGIEGRVLTLRTGDGERLVYQEVTAAEVLSGAWTVTGYFRPDAIVSVIEGTDLTAEFADGRVSGNAGCNQYTGLYETDGSDISIGPIASTLRACADPAVDQQETDFLAALELTRSFRLDGSVLMLLREEGTIAVTLSRT